MHLAAADLRTKHAKVAQEFLAAKGYPAIRPLGVQAVENDQCWYYYYQLPEGLLELEVFQNEDEPRFRRKVTAFVTDKARVRDLLSS